MKKPEIVIKPEKPKDLKEILDECRANGPMITNIMGYGNQKGYNKVNLLPDRFRVDVWLTYVLTRAILEGRKQ